jgi:hypothetical protein
MHQEALTYLADTPAARHLLATYRAVCDSSQADWLPRLFEVEGVEPTSLSALHGKLIAFGCLDVDVSDLATGVRYQVTGFGKQSLSNVPAANAEDRAVATEEAESVGTATSTLAAAG